ncbi:MAG: cysteine desulfurase [Tissierellia bacterium]|jgi:cysteine desulfurase|nr:cysteine desulfurase [Tissierellia bacterium]
MIYLDNCATTKPRESVINVIMESLREDYGNPSSLHRLGLNSEKKIKHAREIISNYLDINKNELFFTSGGTESNNIAIQGIIEKYSARGKHIITTKLEHPSVDNIMKYYESKGYDITYLDNDSFGNIDLNQLKESIRGDTILVSIIHVNNEIGIIQNIEEVRKILNSVQSSALLHLDGVQSFGKIPFSLKSLGVDTFSFSGHKVHGPKGVGGLYINNRLNLPPIVLGGNQESGIRSGTENLSGIIGFGEAVRILSQEFKNEFQQVSIIKEYLANNIMNEIDDIKINSSLDNSSSPYILSVSFRNIRGEVLLHYLEEEEIYVSTTSACSSKGTKKSPILESIGLNDIEIQGTIRFCFSYETSKPDIDYLMGRLKASVKDIRKIIMR